MKKPNKKNEAQPVIKKPVVPKNKKQPSKENKSFAPKVVESKDDVKKSIIQKIEEKMSVKKEDPKLDVSKIVDRVLSVFIVAQVLGLIYLLVK